MLWKPDFGLWIRLQNDLKISWKIPWRIPWRVVRVGPGHAFPDHALKGGLMRIRKICLGVVSVACLVAIYNSAFAQMDRGTPEQRQACEPDALRLCGNYIPDADRIVVCLKANAPQLSPACHDVFFERSAAVEQPKRKKSSGSGPMPR